MHQFIDGEWVTEYEATDEDGSFDRQPTSFRDSIDPGAAEPGRYHLYVSYACPWAHRTLITRKLLGLEDVISVDVVDPYRAEGGWQFTPEKEGCTADSINGFDYLREAYIEADPEYTGRVTVPVLWDTEAGTIVNNESREVMRILTTAFADLGNGVDLAPPERRGEIDDALDRIYEPINNGVYRTGFADTQSAYDEAVAELFEALDYWDGVLEEQRYLVGDRLTEADIAMYTTLVRFDEVYHTHFMCNHKLIREYDHLWPYLRDLYTTPGFGETTHIDHINEHYYTTHPDVSPKRIVPMGPDPDFGAPHDRDELPGEPPV
ncbi:glutathione S-transferase family protein [Natronomonas sp. F2-12]|jgi:putative glutathione S-transferase|uniref:Glutathione S-transferase family protein n=1 Tax=Natronomonas aquatica TaxID=2841590 RepID=A0A9R1CQC1_9EURY|nr:glutathione S-transferase family protein [Natronomonas aquatica]MCQ4331917.1 glutathione S-transferase family protein [Natronomonas aquatica]